MPRLVKKTAHEPFILGDTYICMCGLSANQPFCDGSHKKTLTEDDTKLFWYENGKQEEVGTEVDDCCGGDCGCEDCKK